MLKDLFTAESQSDPHHWSSTYGAHCWLLLGPWGCIAIGWDVWTAAWAVPLLYLVVWEGGQYLYSRKRTRALIADAICDTTAVAFGCAAAAYLAHDHDMKAMYCWCASIIVMAVGWRVRE